MNHSVFHGTALDVSLLIDHLASYIFHGPDAVPIEQHMVVGVSLGGHAAWQIFFNEPRITCIVSIIGCPDYAREFHYLLEIRERPHLLNSPTDIQ
jgi:dienelactone hydrolase